MFHSNAHIVWFQKYPYLPHGRVFTLKPPTPPENSSLASYYPLKILAFETPTPQPSRNSSFTSFYLVKILAFKTPDPLRLSSDHPWGRYGYFLEPHIKKAQKGFLAVFSHTCM